MTTITQKITSISKNIVEIISEYGNYLNEQQYQKLLKAKKLINSVFD